MRRSDSRATFLRATEGTFVRFLAPRLAVELQNTAAVAGGMATTHPKFLSGRPPAKRLVSAYNDRASPERIRSRARPADASTEEVDGKTEQETSYRIACRRLE